MPKERDQKKATAKSKLRRALKDSEVDKVSGGTIPMEPVVNTAQGDPSNPIVIGAVYNGGLPGTPFKG